MSCCRTLRLTCAGLMLWLASVSPASAAPKQVVVLYDERTDLPGLSVLHASLTRRLTSGPPDSVEIYREEMDLSRFGSDGYLLRLRDHLRTKYAGRKIDVVVAAYPPALDFLLTHGDAVFPGAPIVFCGIDRRMLGHSFIAVARDRHSGEAGVRSDPRARAPAASRHRTDRVRGRHVGVRRPARQTGARGARSLRGSPRIHLAHGTADARAAHPPVAVAAADDRAVLDGLPGRRRRALRPA